ncbi:hypothetical protein KEM56_002528 [Ascosphaera pollenicola]|nr:hypothetical protein KEM56_002528 [Ascosphaera pollenicola]
MACSATLPPPVLETVTKKAGFKDDVKIIKTSIDCEELVFALGILPRKSGTKYESLRWIFEERPFDRNHHPSHYDRTAPWDIPKTIVFFNTRKECGECHDILTDDTYEDDKHEILEKFGKDDSLLCIIFATEAIALGVDLPNVRRVMQYKVPGNSKNPKSRNPSILMQRGGRASRDSKAGEILLLVENWVHGEERIMPKKATGRKKQTTTAVVNDKDSDDENDALDADEDEEEVADGNMTIQGKKAAMMRGDLDDTCLLAIVHRKHTDLDAVPTATRRGSLALSMANDFLSATPITLAKKWADKKAAEVFKDHIYALGRDWLLPKDIIETVLLEYRSLFSIEKFEAKIAKQWPYFSQYGFELYDVFQSIVRFIRTPTQVDTAINTPSFHAPSADTADISVAINASVGAALINTSLASFSSVKRPAQADAAMPSPRQPKMSKTNSS